MSHLLEIKNLHARVGDTPILKGINLTMKAGEVHAIMGPNGSGKSTLSYVICGKEDYDVTEGEILFNGTNIQELEPEERAQLGLFLGFQYPVEIPGVNSLYFLKSALNAQRLARGEEELDAMDFMDLVDEKMALLEMDEAFLERPVNVGFSGGEKKRFETLQMNILSPKMAILDETDSGLDIDALKVVGKGVNALRSPEKAILLITHYQRLLDYVEPDFVHILADGKLVKSGDKSLAKELESKGYTGVIGAPAA